MRTTSRIWNVACGALLWVGGVGFLALNSYAQEHDTAGEALVRDDFDSDRPGPVHKRMNGHPLVTIVPGEGTDGSAALQVAYEGYDRGSRRVVGQLPLGRQVEAATLQFDVRFARDFQFVLGGKMHGLGPASAVTGGNEMEPHRWSARIMWHAGVPQTYLYIQNKSGRYGQARRADNFTFEKDRYYAVSLYVRLNDPDQDNGLAEIYVNGEKQVTHDKARFRSVDGDGTLIQKLLFSTFHGGSAPKWAPRDEDGNYTTVHAYYDNFAVYEGQRVREQPGLP